MPKTAARAAWSRFWFSLLLLPVLHSCNHHSSESASSAQTAKDLRPVTHLPAESVGWTEIINNLVGAFDDVDVVALGETHGRKMDSDLRLRLIRAPAFSLKVRSIVVESANSLYQPLLDRYIQGDDIPPSDLAQVWRNVVAIRGADSKVYEEFFAAVREVNLSLPSSRRVRVVAGDPPIDWKRVHVRSDIEPFLERRDFPVSLGKTAVGKGEKALVIYGNAHVTRPRFPLWAAGIETRVAFAQAPLRTGTPVFVRAIEVSGPDRVFAVQSCPEAEPGRVLPRLIVPAKSPSTAAQYDACFFDGEPDADSIIGPDASPGADAQYAAEVTRRLRAFQSSR